MQGARVSRMFSATQNYLNENEGRNYTFCAKKIASLIVENSKPERGLACHFKAVRASHLLAVGGYFLAARLGV